VQTNKALIVEPIGLDLATLPKPIDWGAMFENDHPVELEIGSGKGTFITEQAKARPQVNFFGIEWANWFYRYASDRLRRNNCMNARMVRADAAFILRDHVRPESISVVHIYFPDPWPKARHHKRRLVQQSFIPLVHRTLASGGRVQIVTDHKEYWEENIEPIMRSAVGFEIVDYVRPGSANDGEFVGTNFERKYRREGRPFYAIAAIKK
jgi:tRNA (guanine-N7-)-methyltransferase